MQETNWPNKIAHLFARVFCWGFLAPTVLWPLRFWQGKLDLFRRNPRNLALFLPCFFIMACSLSAGLTEDLTAWTATDGLERMPEIRLNFAGNVMVALQRPLLGLLAWVRYLLGAPAQLAATYALWVVTRWLVYAPFYYGAALMLANLDENEPARVWLRNLGRQFGPEGVAEP